MKKIIILSVLVILSLSFIVGCATREVVEPEISKSSDSKILIKVFSPDEKKYISSDVYVWQDDKFLDKYKSYDDRNIEIPVKIGDNLKLVSLSSDYPYAEKIQYIHVTNTVESVTLNVYKRSDSISLNCQLSAWNKLWDLNEKGLNPTGYVGDENTLLSNPFIASGDYRVRLEYNFGLGLWGFDWNRYSNGQSYYPIKYNQLICNVKNNDPNTRFYLSGIIVDSPSSPTVQLVDFDGTQNVISNHQFNETFYVVKNIDSSTVIKPRIFYGPADFTRTTMTFNFKDDYPKIISISSEDYEKYRWVKDQVTGSLKTPKYTLNILRDPNYVWFDNVNNVDSIKVSNEPECSELCKNEYNTNNWNVQDFNYHSDICCCYLPDKRDNGQGTICDATIKYCYDLDTKQKTVNGWSLCDICLFGQTQSDFGKPCSSYFVTSN